MRCTIFCITNCSRITLNRGAVMNNQIDYDNNSQELLRQFIKQLNEGGMDKDPTIASQDLKYIRGLQRARLARHGVKLQKTYGQAKKDIEGIAWKLDTDTGYVTRIPFKRLQAGTEYISDRAKKSLTKPRLCMATPFGLKVRKNRKRHIPAQTAARPAPSVSLTKAARSAALGF